MDLMRCAVLLALVPGLSVAGEVWSVVRDAAAAPLALARVELTNTSTRAVLSGLTDTDGEIVFSRLAPGKYHLHVASPGFAPWDMNGLEVEEGTFQVEAHLVNARPKRPFFQRLLRRK
jgi:hypothetical protein